MASDYVAECSEADLILARRILRERMRLMRRLAPFAHLLGGSRHASVFFVIAITLGTRSLGSRQMIDDLLRQIYQIANDRLCGRDPVRRLDFLAESLEMMEGDGEAVTPEEFRVAMESYRQRSF